jgi:YHS domain-containing protein
LYLQNPDYYNTASAAPTAPLATDPALTLAAPLASQQQWRGAGSQAASMPSTAQGVSPPGPRAGLASPSARLTPAPTPKPADSTAKKDKSNEPRKDEDAEDILLTSEPAMGGYCPVTLKQKGLWVRGRYDDFAQVDNLVFLTAGPEQREAFDADPAQFVPALGGNCVVSLVDRGEKARGSVFHASQYQGRFYLFADAESKATFNAGPARYATIDMAEGGACVVTLAETGESRPGFAEFAVWYNGLLYRFASAEQKAKFAATPDKYAK